MPPNLVGAKKDSTSRVATLLSLCAGHGADLGGESPLWAKSNWSTSLGKGAQREVGSEGSRQQNKAVTNRKQIRQVMTG